MIIIIFFLDRYSKIQILKNFQENIFYVNDYLNFNLIWNTGIGFGIFSYSSNLFYNIMTTIIGIVILLLVFLSFKYDKTDKIIFSFIIGGALGNFYDRIIFKAVPDFIDIHYNNFHWFTFNIADIFITIGIITFLLKGILKEIINEKIIFIVLVGFIIISCSAAKDASKVLRNEKTNSTDEFLVNKNNL